MYKHECVKCLTIHNYKCIYEISFIDRFFGTEKVVYCPEFLNRIKKLEWRKK
jgi:hypothetical protein